MMVLIFGATGMVGLGVLRECLLAPDVDLVRTICRSATGQRWGKLDEVVLPDLFDLDAVEDQLTGFDACFFCLGVSSGGMDEQTYTHVTYDLTLAVATRLARLNPGMTFAYVSGAGTDSSESGRTMWARVKGRTENALKALPFKSVYLFRPGVIEPLSGITSKTRSYRLAYALLKPVFPLVRLLAPNAIVSTESMGLAMLAVARRGTSQTILDPRQINALALGTGGVRQ